MTWHGSQLVPQHRHMAAINWGHTTRAYYRWHYCGDITGKPWCIPHHYSLDFVKHRLSPRQPDMPTRPADPEWLYYRTNMIPVVCPDQTSSIHANQHDRRSGTDPPWVPQRHLYTLTDHTAIKIWISFPRITGTNWPIRITPTGSDYASDGICTWALALQIPWKCGLLNLCCEKLCLNSGLGNILSAGSWACNPGSPFAAPRSCWVGHTLLIYQEQVSVGVSYWAKGSWLKVQTKKIGIVRVGCDVTVRLPGGARPVLP